MAADTLTLRVRAAWIRRLAWLLGLANSRAGSSMHRSAFYALKDRLLQRYGRLAGVDVQRIVNPCWGYNDDDGCVGAACKRCGGTGVWARKLFVLDRWELGGRIFHRPQHRVWGPEWEARVTIVGRITHEGVSHRASAEARLWLALLFDRALFWRMLCSSRAGELTWRHPLTVLQAVVFEARMLRGRLSPATRECWDCGRTFRTWEPGFVRVRCWRCAPPWSVVPRAEPLTDDDLPF